MLFNFIKLIDNTKLENVILVGKLCLNWQERQEHVQTHKKLYIHYFLPPVKNNILFLLNAYAYNIRIIT